MSNYALNIDPDSGRVLSATFPKYAPAGAVLVDALPDGNISDYRYVNGEYINDPLPVVEPEPVIDPVETLAGRVDAMEITTDDLVLMMADLIGGE